MHHAKQLPDMVPIGLDDTNLLQRYRDAEQSGHEKEAHQLKQLIEARGLDVSASRQTHAPQPQFDDFWNDPMFGLDDDDPELAATIAASLADSSGPTNTSPPKPAAQGFPFQSPSPMFAPPPAVDWSQIPAPPTKDKAKDKDGFALPFPMPALQLPPSASTAGPALKKAKVATPAGGDAAVTTKPAAPVELKRKHPVIMGYELYPEDDVDGANDAHLEAANRTGRRFFGADVFENQGASHIQKPGERTYQRLAREQAEYQVDLQAAAGTEKNAKKAKALRDGVAPPSVSGISSRTRVKAEHQGRYSAAVASGLGTTPDDFDTTTKAKKLKPPSWTRYTSGANRIDQSMNPAPGNIGNFVNQVLGDYGIGKSKQGRPFSMTMVADSKLSDQDLANLMHQHLRDGRPFAATDFPNATDGAATANQITNLLATQLGEVNRYGNRGSSTKKKNGKGPLATTKKEPLPVGQGLQLGLGLAAQGTHPLGQIFGAGGNYNTSKSLDRSNAPFGEANPKGAAQNEDAMVNTFHDQFAIRRDQARAVLQADPEAVKLAAEKKVDLGKVHPRPLSTTIKQQLKGVYGCDSDSDGEDAPYQTPPGSPLG